MDNLNKPSVQKVEFENQGERPSGYSCQRKTSKIIELTIKYSGGIIKDEKQASYVLAIISVLVIAVSLFTIFKGESVPNIPPPANYPPLQSK